MNKKKTFGDYFNKGEFTVYEIDYKKEKIKKAKIEIRLNVSDSGEEYGTFLHKECGCTFMMLSKKEMNKLSKDSRTSGEFLYKEDAQEELKNYLMGCIKHFEKKLVEWKAKVETL